MTLMLRVLAVLLLGAGLAGCASQPWTQAEDAAAKARFPLPTDVGLPPR